MPPRRLLLHYMETRSGLQYAIIDPESKEVLSRKDFPGDVKLQNEFATAAIAIAEIGNRRSIMN
jgi:hypothetical protein